MRKTQILPNCLVIGAGKSGSTFLWNQLQQHPDVYMHPRKQLNYFSFEERTRYKGPGPVDPAVRPVTNLRDYLAQFEGAPGAKIVGEASNSYLYSADAAARIRATLPDVKLIAILRNPAERAYSRFLQLVQCGRERITDFSQALKLEEERIREGWWPDFHYVHMGRYHEQLIRYFDAFPSESIRVYLSDDLQRDPQAISKDAFSFLGLDPSFMPDTRVRFSVTGMPQNRRLHWALQKLRKLRPLAQRSLPERLYGHLLVAGSGIHRRNLVRPPLATADREAMMMRYRDDTMRLQPLIARDLSEWLKPCRQDAQACVRGCGQHRRPP